MTTGTSRRWPGDGGGRGMLDTHLRARRPGEDDKKVEWAWAGLGKLG